MFWNMFLPIHEKEHLFSRLNENTHIKKNNYGANGALCLQLLTTTLHLSKKCRSSEEALWMPTTVISGE